VIQVATGLVDVVVVDLGANPMPEPFAAMDRVLEVLTPDVRTFRAAARFLDAAPSVRIDYVLNRAGRSELVPGDVSRAFGSPPIAVVPADTAVARAQASGRLLPERGRAGRAVSRLAGDLFAPDGTNASEEEIVLGS
jgi:Flp pilus assembly CpaE family ATPase